ncbi:MAG TPA: Smr/MutS family protein [Pseudolabrys sp.]|nr:Smr/MutS family protein [Pseudolabrys sp.]
MNSGDGKRRRVLSSEERVLWTTVTKSIAPLRESTATDDDDGAQTASSARPAAHAAKPAPNTPLLTEKKLPPLAPLGRRMKQRVARGKEMIGGRLDLHGLTQSEAHAALLRFLRAASSRGARLVLVITGKGARASEGQRGVLKRQVPQWLGLPEFRMLVIGFEDAHVAHGGEGALYVRIRRKRDQ